MPASPRTRRGAYPIDFIPNCSAENMGPVPQQRRSSSTADAFGVLPPIARLTPEQAMYHFLSGYTAKVAGTEIGVTEPEATFSTCFGAPFMPRHPLGLRQPSEGADRQGRGRLLAGQYRLDRRQIRRRQPHADQGDPRAAQRRARRQPRRASSSARTPISASRCRSACRASSRAILDPRDTWADKADYDATAAKLVGLFIDNFAKFADHVDAGVRDAAPQARPSATSPGDRSSAPPDA